MGISRYSTCTYDEEVQKRQDSPASSRLRDPPRPSTPAVLFDCRLHFGQRPNRYHPSISGHDAASTPLVQADEPNTARSRSQIIYLIITRNDSTHRTAFSILYSTVQFNNPNRICEHTVHEDSSPVTCRSLKIPLQERDRLMCLSQFAAL